MSNIHRIRTPFGQAFGIELGNWVFQFQFTNKRKYVEFMERQKALDAAMHKTWSKERKQNEKSN